MTDAGVGVDRAQTWRPGPGAVVGGVFGYAAAVLFAVVGLGDGTPEGIGFGFTLSIVTALIVGTTAFGPSVSVHEGRCAVRNPIISTSIPVGLIRSASVQQGRLFAYNSQQARYVVISLVNGTEIRCVALTASVVGTAFTRVLRPDRLVPELQQALANTPSAPLTDRLRRRPTLPPWHAWMLAGLIAVFGVVMLQVA